MPHPNKLIGKCSLGMKHTCTDKGNFARDLLRLGKQNQHGPTGRIGRNNRLVEDIVGQSRRRGSFNTSAVPYMANPVFLYDIEQLADTDPERQKQLATSLQNFLGLETPLGPLPRVRPGRVYQAAKQAERNIRKIDICQSEYEPVRRELLRLASNNAEWILTEFIPRVQVANREHLTTILESWRKDPCQADATIIKPFGGGLPRIRGV